MDKEKVKKHLRSKTIKWGYVVAGIQAAHINVALAAPIFDIKTFAIIQSVLVVLNALGAHYLRTKTTGSLDEK